ncbi:hypothetical protein Cgig2_017669 [Carnegiea gigantea]|uniref:Reverse transcriptase zinc-binding domain-containing protein n=1 Tax=Carnegiea gigantea TaxID=171969 RepID=A0A9Q1K2V5_9CARY|nr:hypothetical protein Cgig2_017669 [Carnegiea gigantea]
MKGSRKQKHITYAMVAVAPYRIWRARNTKIFDHKILPVSTIFCYTKELIHRLPIKQRLVKFISHQHAKYSIYKSGEEDETHLFHTCKYAKEVWIGLEKWWEFTPAAQSSQQIMREIKNRKRAKQTKATIYHIWHARNSMISKQQLIPAKQIVQAIKEQASSTICF